MHLMTYWFSFFFSQRLDNIMFLSKLYGLHAPALVSFPSVLIRGCSGEIMPPLCAGKGRMPQWGKKKNQPTKLLGRQACKAQYSAGAELMVNEDEHFRAVAHRRLLCDRHRLAPVGPHQQSMSETCLTGCSARWTAITAIRYLFFIIILEATDHWLTMAVVTIKLTAQLTMISWIRHVQSGVVG